MKVTVLEVDQWTSTGDVEGKLLSEFCLREIRGGDSEAARALGIASARLREVDENQRPGIGDVWYRVDENGRLVFWKANYDTSG